MHYSRQKKYQFLIVSSSVLVLGWMFFINPPKDRLDNVYEPQDELKNKIFENVQFQNVAKNLGINYRHSYDEEKHAFDLNIESLPPSVSIVDINQDGFVDIFVTTELRKKNLLYINNKGMSFTEEAESYGLADLNQLSAPSYSLWGDFNEDGVLDLLFARHGCHSFFVGSKINGKVRFKEKNELINHYCSRPNGVNVGDFYNNGKLNFVFSNFLPAPGDESFVQLWTAYTRYDNMTGGSNVILKNDNGKYVLDKNANFKTRSYSHNAGINDVNADGKVDVFFSNDYAHDELFLNLGNGFFKDATNEFIPKRLHGLSGMNTEFFDYNHDGLMDLYVTNIHKPPFNRHFNLLWQKEKNGTFKNVSNDLNVARCGFSWAAKFADFNLDGESDLFVVNGRDRSPEVTSMHKGKSMWFERAEISQIPRFLKSYYKIDKSIDGRYISAFERKCLFMQHQGKFYDVSMNAGVADTEENRGMALLDFNNDGRMDLLTSGPLAEVKLFKNESNIEKKNHWIGFRFTNKLGFDINHGLKMKFKLSDGKIIYREIYPANGYRGFNDSRILVGLGASEIISDIMVYWPNTQIWKNYKNVKKNKYNEIYEDNVEIQ